MSNQNLFKLGILLVGIFIFYYLLIFLPQNKQQKIVFNIEQQLKCDKYGSDQQNEELDRIYRETSGDNDFYGQTFFFSEKLSTCVQYTKRIDLKTQETVSYRLYDLYNKKELAFYGKGCQVSCSDNLNDFNKKKMEIIGN